MLMNVTWGQTIAPKMGPQFVATQLDHMRVLVLQALKATDLFAMVENYYILVSLSDNI